MRYCQYHHDSKVAPAPPQSILRWVTLAAVPFAGLIVLGNLLMARWLPTHPSDDLPHNLAMTLVVP